DTWEPGKALDGSLPGYFLVLQSITAAKLDFDLVKARWVAAAELNFPDFHHPSSAGISHET
ncbi:MAG: hypothetical protein B7Z80_18420, partial [Rhodospirillales bacterium 20-64-7]